MLLLFISLLLCFDGLDNCVKVLLCCWSRSRPFCKDDLAVELQQQDSIPSYPSPIVATPIGSMLQRLVKDRTLVGNVGPKRTTV